MDRKAIQDRLVKEVLQVRTGRTAREGSRDPWGLEDLRAPQVQWVLEVQRALQAQRVLEAQRALKVLQVKTGKTGATD